MTRTGIGLTVLGVAIAAGIAVALVNTDVLDRVGPRAAAPEVQPMPPAVSVVRAEPAPFTETVLVTGSLVPREEILVGPEIEGLRVLEVLADEGDRVKKGQVLARLVQETLEAQVAQNDAALARTRAAIAQASSAITQAEARVMEAQNAYDRSVPLRQAGHISQAAFEQRESAARTAQAQLLAARDGLKVAEAERAQVEAQRRELNWRRERTEVMAPADGVISRRNARVGAFASGMGEPMFRIIANGEVELDAEVTETKLTRVKEGQRAHIEVAGLGTVEGRVRLVSPEVDKSTRLGRVRVFLGDNSALHVGAFGRGLIETASGTGLAVPASAVLYGVDGAQIQVARDGVIETRRVKLGLSGADFVEVREGLSEGELVVAKAGTFLRARDAVRPVLQERRKVSEAH